MTPEQKSHLIKNYPARSIDQLAKELGLDRREIRREISKLQPQKQPTQKNAGAHSAAFRHGFWLHALIALFLTAFTFIIYSPALSYPFSNWDDPTYVTENPLIKQISTEHLKRIFTKPYYALYLPLTMLSYSLNYYFSHLDPFAYHFTNLMLHLMSMLLVYATVQVLTGEWLVAAAVSVLFGIHPVQVESVVWISERKNVLSGFFILSSFFLYALSRRTRSWRGWSLAGSFVFFGMACFSKPISVILPVLMLVFDWCYGYLERGLKAVRSYLPMFFLAVI